MYIKSNRRYKYYIRIVFNNACMGFSSYLIEFSSIFFSSFLHHLIEL